MKEGERETAPLAPFSSLHPCPWEEVESGWVELMEETIGLLAKGGLFPPSYLFPSLINSTRSPPPPPPPSVNIHHVYRLSPHPTQPSSLISAVSYNNEISIWDMETATRRQMLWASPAPAFGEITNSVSS